MALKAADIAEAELRGHATAELVAFLWSNFPSVRSILAQNQTLTWKQKWEVFKNSSGRKEPYKVQLAEQHTQTDFAELRYRILHTKLTQNQIKQLLEGGNLTSAETEVLLEFNMLNKPNISRITEQNRAPVSSLLTHQVNIEKGLQWHLAKQAGKNWPLSVSLMLHYEAQNLCEKENRTFDPQNTRKIRFESITLVLNDREHVQNTFQNPKSLGNLQAKLGLVMDNDQELVKQLLKTHVGVRLGREILHECIAVQDLNEENEELLREHLETSRKKHVQRTKNLLNSRIEGAYSADIHPGRTFIHIREEKTRKAYIETNREKTWQAGTEALTNIGMVKSSPEGPYIWKSPTRHLPNRERPSKVSAKKQRQVDLLQRSFGNNMQNWQTYLILAQNASIKTEELVESVLKLDTQTAKIEQEN